jgi:adenylate cyclase class 2
VCKEIEAKLKVDSLGPIEEKLRALGGSFAGQRFQCDCYFDDSESRMIKSDTCLRLRYQKADNGQEVFVTFKGPKEAGRYKSRREIEFEVGDAEAAEKLFLELGYAKSEVVEKIRRLWQLGGCQIGLDDVKGLGSFVEIEGPDEQIIAEVQEQMGLADSRHVKKSYAALIREKR